MRISANDGKRRVQTAYFEVRDGVVQKYWVETTKG